MFPEKIRHKIEVGKADQIKEFRPVGGGCISETGVLIFSSGESAFVKTRSSSQPSDMLPKEAHGLQALRESGALRIPQVYQIDEDFLLMEYIAPGHQKADFFSRLGRGLARMHKKTSPTFGFHQDNYCGAIPQKNRPPMKDWSEFYFHNRLLFQLNLLEKKGYVLDGLPAKISALGKKLPGLLKGSEEPPSLLHGDLWGGNYLVDENGDPALMDPAVYYGHREAELGMTLLFGGFTQDFYQSYEAAYPLAPGWQKRMGLYKLYHLMNHCNLFGTSYLGQCHDVLDEYV